MIDIGRLLGLEMSQEIAERSLCALRTRQAFNRAAANERAARKSHGGCSVTVFSDGSALNLFCTDDRKVEAVQDEFKASAPGRVAVVELDDGDDIMICVDKLIRSGQRPGKRVELEWNGGSITLPEDDWRHAIKSLQETPAPNLSEG